MQLPILNFQLISQQEQMCQTTEKALKTQGCYVITFWMCTITACALVKPMHTKQTAQYNRIPFTFSTNCVLRVSVNHYHIPSTLFLDSCFSGSTLEVTAEAGDFSAVIEVICRHILCVLI